MIWIAGAIYLLVLLGLFLHLLSLDGPGEAEP